jgi:hypothetical protein
MICDCGELIKNNTFTGGISSLEGSLTTYEINNEIFINRCCFHTIIPSLYMTISKEWLLYSGIIVYDPSMVQVSIEDRRRFGLNTKIKHVYKLKPTTFEKIKALGDNLELIQIQTVFMIETEYKKCTDKFKSAHSHIIELESNINEIKFKYSATFAQTKPIRSEPIDIKKESTTVKQSPDFREIKERIKETHRIASEELSKTKLELAIAQTKIREYTEEISNLREENSKLRDHNRLLSLNSKSSIIGVSKNSMYN